MTGQRIALIHFTAAPAVGGVEALLAAQAETLHGHGHDVTVVAGSGEPSSDYQVVIVPEIHPDATDVRAARLEDQPDSGHPVVRNIAARLGPLLEAQDQIWVHNAFTVYLNPFLTVALHRLHEEFSDRRWVAFCHDLTTGSRYVDGPTCVTLPRLPKIRSVVLSRTRRQELARNLGIPEDRIDVIPPPLDAVSWLGSGDEAREVLCATRLFDRDISVLVPSKLLPHKRIDRAIGVTAQLKRKGVNALLLVTGASSPHEPGVSERISVELGTLVQGAGVADNVCLVSECLGRIPLWRTVRDLMGVCDLVLLLSAEEGYGTPIDEAIALRVPVVCSDIPAFHEAGGDDATYVNGDDPEEVAEQMLRIAQAPSAVHRRHVMRSMARYQEAILHLANEH